MSTEFYQLDDAGQAAAMQVLADAALAQWGLQGSELELIKYRENGVFKVLTPEGQRYALRIHRHAYHSDEELRSELQWLAALQAAGISVPQMLPALSGELFLTVQVGEVPEPRQVDIMAWLEGEQLGSIEGGLAADGAVEQIYHTIGGLAARLHNQAARWVLPEGFSRHAWDIEGLVGDTPFWGPFWELAALTDDERALLLRARDRVRDDLARYAADPANADRYSLIHADFVVENLLVDGDTVRLIDFDDAGFGWHLFELATALHFEMEEDFFSAAFDAMVSGYRAHRDLPDAQLAHMPLFFLARSFTYLGWVRTRSETQTAKELTPMLVEKCCTLARAYLEV
ncbi:MAG: phosphotransferase [Halieaceae bacterium]